MSLCLFDSFSCKQTPTFKNEGDKKEVDKKDSFLVNGQWATLEDFFSKDFGPFRKEISPKARLESIKSNPDLKYRKDSKGEFITLDGKELKLSKELLDYIDVQDKLFNGNGNQNRFARTNHSLDSSSDQKGPRRYKELVHVPSKNLALWLHKAQILYLRRHSE